MNYNSRRDDVKLSVNKNPPHRKSFKPCLKKTAPVLVIVFLLYLLIGMLAPFAVQKSVDPNAGIPADRYYGDSLSPDRARIVETGAEALSQRIRMIVNAKERVVLSTFDMREGESTRDIVAALIDAAGRGVRVQVLVDGVSGLIRMEVRPLFYALSAHPNIEVRTYNRPNPLKPWTINGRMHDKYLIADNTCYLLGGRNTFDYFLGDYTEKNQSYDREILIYNTGKGDAESSIKELERCFQTGPSSIRPTPYSARICTTGWPRQRPVSPTSPWSSIPWRMETILSPPATI